LVEGWNDFARTINAVRAVVPADVTMLHRNPMPQEYTPPFQDPVPPPIVGQSPPDAFAFPADFLAGSNRLDASTATGVELWAQTWGIPVRSTLPDIDALLALPSKRWRLQADSEGRPVGFVLETLETTALDWWWRVNLFGDAGPYDLYKWVARADAALVFDPLGIKLPPGIVGERFTPIYAGDTAYTLVAGAFSEEPVDFFVTGELADYFIRAPEPAGTWTRKLSDHFRVIGVGGSSKKRMFATNFTPGVPGTESTVTVEIDEVGERYDRNSYSPLVAVPQGDNALPPDPSWNVGYPAWPSVASFIVPGGGRFIATPEPYDVRTWDAPVPPYPEDASVAWTSARVSPPSNTMVVLDVPPGTVVTTLAITDASDMDWPCWHVCVI
jgi:hypothetical protein